MHQLINVNSHDSFPVINDNLGDKNKVSCHNDNSGDKKVFLLHVIT